MQLQMVCLQYVETRKWGAIEFLTFAWIVFTLLLSIGILTKKTQLALFHTLSVSVWFTQTFDDVSIKRRNDSWFAYSWLWGLQTSIFTTIWQRFTDKTPPYPRFAAKFVSKGCKTSVNFTASLENVNFAILVWQYSRSPIYVAILDENPSFKYMYVSTRKWQQIRSEKNILKDSLWDNYMRIFLCTQ